MTLHSFYDSMLFYYTINLYIDSEEHTPTAYCIWQYIAVTRRHAHLILAKQMAIRIAHTKHTVHL